MDCVRKPNNLHILGRKYALKSKIRLQNGQNDGLCDLELKEITIDASLKGDEYFVALVHEIIHAVLHEGSISPVISHDVEEIIADLVGKWLVENLDMTFKKKTRS